ncbi:hypothetical protein NUKP64_11500 [Klebsiella variicola]|nr:hypothetical protein NUBL22018_00540 [Klebsiella variicola]GKJ01466.1 hypothetical protein NUKP23_05820 [Klebsiella variicola]GKK13451.1 hypothetical protein NUKP38_25150 [Klebsiella variicola]GKK33197.1 hypothetical protein NUKP39_25760 [Klebsiella variicola]GKK66100.1 hypothetical protein NUKP41_06170 [Klebsiella variicola]
MGKPGAKGSTAVVHSASQVRCVLAHFFLIFWQESSVNGRKRGGEYEMRKKAVRKQKRKSPVKTGLYIALEWEIISRKPAGYVNPAP